MKNKRIKILIAAVILLCVAAVLIFVFRNDNTSDAEKTGISLRLPIPIVDMAFAPYYVAADRGIFESHALDVVIEPGSAELNPVALVAQGVDDFGVLGGPELLLRARSQGLPLVGIALTHVDSDFVVLLTRTESGITELPQLAGQRVGFFFGHISTDILRMLFAINKVQIEEVDVGFDYSPLLTGRVAAEWAFRTTAGIQLPARGERINIISPAAYGIHTHGHVLVTNEDNVRTRPELVQRFVDAFLEATQYELDHPDDAIAAAQSRDASFSVEVAKKQIEIYHAAIKRNPQIGAFPKNAVERAWSQMQSAGVVAGNINPSDAYTNAFVDAHYARAKAE